MKIKKNLHWVLLAGAALILMACGENKPEPQPEPGAEPMADMTAESDLPEFDPALDPFKVGAEFTRELGDTLGIKMYEFTMKPGDSVGLHQHLDHTVYVLEGGTLMVYVNGTDPVEYVLNTGDAIVGGPLTDSAVNIGDTDIVFIGTEVHRPR